MPRRSRREEPESEEALERLDRRSDPFAKTKMCKFNILGMCTRGDSCQFAHERVELNQLPDLVRTKLCKRLINTGTCDDPHCKYAHNKEELREHPIPRVDRSVRIGGYAGEDPPTMMQTGNFRPAVVAKVSHDVVGQMGGRYAPQQATMGADAGGGCNQAWTQQVGQTQEFCAPSSSSNTKKKYHIGDWDQFEANQRLFGTTSTFKHDLSQYSTPPYVHSGHSEAPNMVYSGERWPGDCGFGLKGNTGGRSCSSDNDAKSGFGSDNSSVTLPPDHLLGGDHFRLERTSWSEDSLANAKMIQALGHHANLRFQNGQMMAMPTMHSMIQEAEVAAGHPYIPCQNGPMNNMNVNCYNAKVQTMMQGGGYPMVEMSTQPTPQHVWGLAEMLGAEDYSVKNTFLNFAPSTPNLRNVQTAAGRLDLMGEE